LKEINVQEKTVATLRNVCRIPKFFLELEISEMDVSDSRDSIVLANTLDEFLKVGDEVLNTLKYIEGDPIFFWIRGKYGSGKTRVATWLLKKAYLGMKGRSFGYNFDFRPLFMTASEITEYRFKKFNCSTDEEIDYEEMRDRIFGCSFLVIDDIGKIASYKGEKHFIERVIEERWNERLSTVITSNIDAKEISDRFDDFVSTFDQFTMIGKSRKERENNE
jgi:DNA replication protein DnaC